LLLLKRWSLSTVSKLQLRSNTCELWWQDIRALLRLLVEEIDALFIFALQPSTAKFAEDLARSLRCRLRCRLPLLLLLLLLHTHLWWWGIRALLRLLVEVVDSLSILALQPPAAEITYHLGLSLLLRLRSKPLNRLRLCCHLLSCQGVDI